MDITRYVTEIANRLIPANQTKNLASLFSVLLHELIKGQSVSPTILATALNCDLEQLASILKEIPGIEYDNTGDIVGYGLTQRETMHTVEINGQRLYTWCALDTLIFPPLLNQTAYVHSRCASTSVPILLTVTPDEVLDITPSDAVVSLILPQNKTDIRLSFCCHVHFFASSRVAHDWALEHPRVEIVTVQEAYELGRKLARHFSAVGQATN